MSDRLCELETEANKLAILLTSKCEEVDGLEVEVERLRVELMGQFGAYRMAADDATEKKVTIATMGERMSLFEQLLYEVRQSYAEMPDGFGFLDAHLPIVMEKVKALVTPAKEKP